jgi:hypothetical protein
MFFGQDGQPGRTAFGNEYAIAVRAEQAAQGGQDARFVVDKQQRRRVVRLGHGEFSWAWSTGWMGNITRKVVPLSGSLSTVISPWWRSTIL